MYAGYHNLYVCSFLVMNGIINFLGFVIELIFFNITVNNHQLIINAQYKHEQVESVLHLQHQYTQTEPKFSNHSPRKKF